MHFIFPLIVVNKNYLIKQHFKVKNDYFIHPKKKSNEPL